MTGVWLTVIAAFVAFAPLAAAPAHADGLANRIILPARAPAHLRAPAPARTAAAERAGGGGLQVVDFLGGEGRQLMDLLAGTGIDPARLLRGVLRVAKPDVGGPFQALTEGQPLPEAEMAALVERVRTTVPLASPVRDPHRFTSGFGARSDPFRKRSAFHRGIDLAGPRGTPIFATAAGTVVHAGRHGAYGNVVEIDHGNGVQTLYAHLHEYHVRLGDSVGAGQRIGRMGRTGRATGVHLHYEVIVDGRPVDPERFLRVGEMLLASAS